MSKLIGNNLQAEGIQSINGIPINDLGGGGDGGNYIQEGSNANTYLIYKLTFPNNKCYIGITNNFKKRMTGHRSASKIKKYKLYDAIRKYGWGNVTKEILLENIPISEIEELEIKFIKKFNSIKNGYNLKNGGRLSKHNSESIEKMKKIQSSPEVIKRKSEYFKEFMKSKERRKISSENLINYNKSKKHSNNMKKNWLENSEYRKKMTLDFQKRKKSMIEKSHTPEAIKKRKETIQKRIDKGDVIWPGRNPYKKVICLNSGIIYDSVRDCANKLNLLQKGIRRCCNGQRKSYLGLQFSYFKDILAETL